MSARLLGILVAVLVVLGGAALWLHRAERTSEAPAENMLGEPLLRGLHGADIAMIRITAPDAKLTLRREGARWVVAERGDFPADLAKVRDFVVQALSLKVGQSDSIGAADRARLRLDEPSAAKGGGTLVEFAGADGKPLASMIVGAKYFKRTPDNPKTAKVDGRFVLRPASTNTAVIVADPLDQAVADGAQWIDHHALAAEDPVSIDVRHADGDHWRLERGADASGAWKLVDAKPGEKLSETTVLSVAAAAGGLDIADVIAKDPQRAEKDLAKPTVVTIVSRDGLTYTLDIGARVDRNYYAVAKIEGDLPAARKPVDGEKAADAAARDKAFAERIAKVRARLPDAQTLAKHALLIPDTTLVDLTKKRADLLEKPPAKGH
jgi:Domain of unknown function (DUF4340)